MKKMNDQVIIFGLNTRVTTGHSLSVDSGTIY